MINIRSLQESFLDFSVKRPFSYAVIDNFLDENLAQLIANEFPQFNSELYNGNYSNQLELKKTCNIWDRFSANTYSLFYYLNSEIFLDEISRLTGTKNLKSDPGLHGGGQHCYPAGGKLNPHLDYYIHPKLNLTRKYNLLVYLTPNWKKEWGGELGFWSVDNNGNPLEVEIEISPMFNRAVLFDTTMNSWHGLSKNITCPSNLTRNSIAVYYLANENNHSSRKRALFYPTNEQKNDKEVLNLIERRSKTNGNNVQFWDRK
jgi:Rps23 Pro-64 3,4-dihydroxylase Tpa1-like proline 4-hydroxylase